MKIVIPGGTGDRGRAVARHWTSAGHEVVVLTRSPKAPGEVHWDGQNLGDWVKAIDGADVVLNLAGRSVNCRYNKENLRQMMDSRVSSTRVVGQAIQKAQSPPRVWLQISTATIYAHRFDAANDETTGIIGGNEPGAPPKWTSSISVAKSWEEELHKAETPSTRKVTIRASMVMGPEKGGVFDTLRRLARRGLAGRAGDGRQFISWIHEADFHRALDFIIACDDLSGPVNVAAPNPLPNQDFNLILRQAIGVKVGLPATKWMLEVGAWLMGTETELILKSRRVIPGRLLAAGFQFSFPNWEQAAQSLAAA